MGGSIGVCQRLSTLDDVLAVAIVAKPCGRNAAAIRCLQQPASAGSIEGRATAALPHWVKMRSARSSTSPAGRLGRVAYQRCHRPGGSHRGSVAEIPTLTTLIGIASKPRFVHQRFSSATSRCVRYSRTRACEHGPACAPYRAVSRHHCYAAWYRTPPPHVSLAHGDGFIPTTARTAPVPRISHDRQRVRRPWDHANRYPTGQTHSAPGGIRPAPSACR